LRVREPRLERYSQIEMDTNCRPYRVFITTPVIFCCAALFLLSRGVFSAPLQALFAAIFIFAGVPLYYIFITGWRHFPGLRITSLTISLIIGFLGIKPVDGGRIRGYSLTSLTGRDRGYSLASQGRGLNNEEVEMMERT
jgi:hypothetical protein